MVPYTDMARATRSKTPEHLRFAVLASDTVLFTIRENELLVRVVAVNRPPSYVDCVGFTGGLLMPHETAEESALRLLQEKGGIEARKVFMEQLYTFSNIDRDPRGRVVAVAYLALVPWEQLSHEERLDTKEAWWSPISSKHRYAYDHKEMLALAVRRLRSRITYTTLISKFLPEEFTLTELERAYTCILGTSLDKRNFRKKMLSVSVLTPLRKKKRVGAYRPAQLFSFKHSSVQEIEIF